MDLSIIECGARPDALIAENRAAIQKAIDTVHHHGGGTVIIPPGRFESGGIILRSHVTLKLEEGAELCGSGDLSDYSTHSIEHFSTPGGERPYTAFIFAEAAEYIGIEGPGTIYGNGSAEMFRSYPVEEGGAGGWHRPARPWGIRLWRCAHVSLDSYYLESSAEWSHHICDCEHVTVRGIRIFNHSNANNDGLDFDGSRHVLVEDCDIDADDDGLCLKATGFRANTDIVVRRCRIASRCRAIHLGSESSGRYERILFEDIDIVPSKARDRVDVNRPDESDCAIEIFSIEGSHMRNICFRDIRINGADVAMCAHVGLISPDRPKYAGHTLSEGSISDLRFERIHGTLSSNVASSFTSGPNAPAIKGLVLSDIHLQTPGDPQNFHHTVADLGSRDEDSTFHYGWHAKGFQQELPAKDLFCRGVEDLTLNQIQIVPRHDDPRPDFIIE